MAGGKPNTGSTTQRAISCIPTVQRLVRPSSYFLPYVPMLFQGEEWGASAPFQYFVDFSSEPELASSVAKGRRSEFASFGWKPEDIPNPNDPVTFARSKLNWQEIGQPRHDEMLRWHRSLIELRKCVSAFTTGRLDDVATQCSEEDKWLRIGRGPVTIVCNFATESRLVPLTAGRDYHLLLASKPVERSSESGVTLPPESVVIFGPGIPH